MALNSPLRPRALLDPYQVHREICKACPVLISAEQDGRNYPPDNKKMTPFDDPIHNIHTSYVGATYHVARFPATGGWITALKRTNGALNHHYRTSLVRLDWYWANVSQRKFKEGANFEQVS